MRKVILSMMISVDGFIEGKDPEFNWQIGMVKWKPI